ncbi:CSLREA domain-containing protein [Acinetobacter bereziniae]|uniref:CSLREA domain-containing protein n=1 Tax=Acinetobacter bereziniae TaxID=106648 RepID=UPI00124F97C3|nr:CSLREA domain-containing protein [Acinetobacter bereziniae]MDA3438752.1 CSLREA domain-containing protein [Acinetobacter bereziniae]
MKNYKKGFLTLVILSTMSLMAAEDKTIYVTTFDDEDGTNPDKCSLREALHAAAIHKAYGGCSAGQIYSTVPNVIQLEAGEYKLNKELRPNSDVSIVGKEPGDYSRPDVLTNQFPAATPIKTTISGQGNSRIFNTIYENKPGLVLNDLILKDGSSLGDSNYSVGGAIYAGGALTLNNVTILNSKAKVGGAIYLNDVTSSLNINYGVFDGNSADQGSVLGMTCSDNLGFTTRTIGINYASFLRNGSENSLSMFSFCGQPAITLTANTITDNIANSNQGSIIQFTQKTPQGNVSLGNYATLSLTSNTIVKNTAWSTLLYGFNGVKALSNNILAYNTGKSCRYADGDVSKVEKTSVVLNYNALTMSAGNDQCEVAEEVRKDDKDNTFDVSNINFSTLLNELEPPSESTGFMPMYFPKNLGTDKDLVDIGYTGCSGKDQRGVTRVIAENSNGENDVANSCDIGSTEVLRLTANNLSATNSSVVEMLNSYQTVLDNYNKLLEDPATNKDYIPFYKIQSETYSNLIKYTKSEQKYRTIFVDPFAANLPAEIVTKDANGQDTRLVKHLNTDNYTVTVKALGVGTLNDKKVFVGKEDPNFKCEWNPNLKRIMLWRINDNVTPSGDNEFCSYQLQLIADPSIKSSAYIIGSFTNIAPIAKDATLNIEYGSTKPLDVDLLQYANDDGDGNVAALTAKPNKPKFYVNPEGIELPIRIANTIDPVVITSDRSGPCPGDDGKYTCYSGKVHIQLRSTLDPFSYNFTYYVYDADGKISNSATVKLQNSGTAPGSPRVSGGGAFGWVSLFGLFGLVGYRRYQMYKQAK